MLDKTLLSPNYYAIGRRIQKERKKKHLTQETTAKALGLSRSFYGNIECGRAKMSMDTFAIVCDVLDCDAHYILFGTPWD